MSEQVTPAEVLAFWLDEVGPEGWYNSTDALDETIRTRFLSTWELGAEGGLSDWLQNAEGAMAYVILLDQFPRNMFRGAGQSFATDKKSLCAAKCAITKGWDLKAEEPQRQFFYLPLMHSESLSDQDRCIRLMMERMPETGAANLCSTHALTARSFVSSVASPIAMRLWGAQPPVTKPSIWRMADMVRP